MLIDDLQGACGAPTAAAVVEGLREFVSWSKDQLGRVWTLADLPASVVTQLKGPVIASLSNPGTRPAGVDPGFAAWLLQLGVSSGLVQTQQANPGGRGQNLNALQGQDAAHELNSVFANPTRYWRFFSSVNTSDLQLPPAVQAKVTAERRRLRAFTRRDWAKVLQTFRSASQDFADAVGAGDPMFSTTLGRPTVSTPRTPNDDDFQVMFTLNDIIMAVEPLAAFNDSGSVPANPLDFVAGYFGAPVRSSPGKFAVPWPYGATLESMAIRYLDDIDRAPEIAALNNLREPYVDEQGFDLPLLVNGSGVQVTVASAQDLAVNQLVYVRAAGQLNSLRHVLAITSVGAGQYFVLTLDGLPNLNAFTVAQGAAVHAWLPGTVNSQCQVYIPSATPPPAPEFNTSGNIPGVNPFEQFFNVGGMDLLLTSDNDLVVDPSGDTRWSFGLTNIIQTARLALATPRGNLKRHLSYGFPRLAGQSIADADAQSLLAAATGLFTGDPTFAGVAYAGVTLEGPVAKLFLGVKVAGASTVLPIGFDVPA
jgi:hypothetical protein